MAKKKKISLALKVTCLFLMGLLLYYYSVQSFQVNKGGIFCALEDKKLGDLKSKEVTISTERCCEIHRNVFCRHF